MLNGKKRCFVLMGFGVKVDYKTNRSLDLDKTYKIIRRAVDAAGLECIRADDIVHSGLIDKPMYENLLAADVAIADLSTSNENAIYELGVRHALKPWTTIVIAEKQFKFPFDLTHLVIRPYEHLGTGIDYDEAERLQKELTAAILTITNADTVDSPVYTFLPDLVPPSVRGAIAIGTALMAPDQPTSGAAADNPTFTVLLEAFRAARKKGDFLTAKAYVEKLRENKKDDPYLVQQHALMTYKSRTPNTIDALREARQILETLQPETSGDPETLGLWGAIHKRLWEETADRSALDEGIAAYERGFYMKRDYYTGINYAFMLDDRARVQAAPDEATADHVLARRVRRQLIAIVDATLKGMPSDEHGRIADLAEWYWVEATRVEALMGLGEPQFKAARDALFAAAPESWMKEATQTQLDKLAARLP
jgi:Tetratricopeptide Repeats-Sensor